MKPLTAIGLIVAIIGISGCVTTVTDTQRSDYEAHAPEIMAFVADKTGKPAAPIPNVEFHDLGDWGAFHRARDNTVILRHDWQPDTEGLGDLAHEFTHAVQHFHDPLALKQQIAWDAQLKSGDTSNIGEIADSVLQTCLEREFEAYQVSIAYRVSIDPKAVKRETMGLPYDDVAAIWAKSSCAEVKVWHDNIKNKQPNKTIDKGGATYTLERVN